MVQMVQDFSKDEGGLLILNKSQEEEGQKPNASISITLSLLVPSVWPKDDLSGSIKLSLRPAAAFGLRQNY